MNPATAAEDFPVTRSTIEELDGWLHRLATPVLPARRVQRDGRHRWELRERNAYALMIAKAVRMVSGTRAAMLLIDNGFLPESACLLRIVSDLSLEVVAVAEGELRGQPTKAQQDFVAEFFARKSFGEDPGLKREKKRYVSREELMKTHVRLATAVRVDGEDLRDKMLAVASVYDGFVHGSYSSAMELYQGSRHHFMLQGHEGIEQRVVYRRALAGKLHEVIHSLVMISHVTGDEVVHSDILAGLTRLQESKESVG
jgi:hypothetical protein